MKTIYIAGKVTGVPVAIRTAKFEAAETMLQNRGFKTLNPIKLVKDPNTPWQEAMDICIQAVKACDSIYMLPCSTDSPGAKLELQIAMEMNKDIYYELENLEDNED
jgi:hypothetical protein